MFDFISKETLWNGLDENYLKELDDKIPFQLKTAQDIAVYGYLREKSGLVIAEMGGGNSRILRQLALNNRCFNIDRFEGTGCGPRKEITIGGVENIAAFVGEESPLLRDGQFDIVFSISVVEHVDTSVLDTFHNDLIRILKPGGLFFHAIDVYVHNKPTAYHIDRFKRYREWVTRDERIEPVGEVYQGDLRFRCDMATNPDNIMHEWSRNAPRLIPLRKQSQLVSLLVGGRKRS